LAVVMHHVSVTLPGAKAPSPLAFRVLVLGPEVMSPLKERKAMMPPF
jgi:hypothetical protein